jgi:ribulose-phosphate 3-epimerase
MSCSEITPIEIEVDGCVTAENARAVVDAGASILVAGLAIFGGPYEERIAAIRTSAECARRIQRVW